MNKTAKKIFIVIFVLTVGTLAVRILAQTCRTEKRTFTENFDTTDFKDLTEGINSVAQWPQGPIELNRLGADFSMTKPGGLGGFIYVCDSGDFNNDGYPDLIGLDIWRQRHDPVLYNPRSCLVFVKNNSAGLPQASFAIDPVDPEHSDGFDRFNAHTGPAAITVGKYNGDSLLDFFFIRDSTDDFAHNDFQAVMYINVGTSTAPDFRPYNQSPTLDFTNKFEAAGIYVNWAGNHLCSVDIDKDGDVDILAISQDRIFLIRNPGPADAANLDNWNISELGYTQRTGFNGDMGGSCVSAADFDGDGDIEIVCGTVDHEYGYLAYYDNDGLGYFIRMDIPIPPAYVTTCVSPVGLSTKDFNNDGRPDIFGAGDSAHSGNPDSHMWMLTNKGTMDMPVTMPDGSEETVKVIQWQFKCLNSCNPVGGPPSYDTDIVTPLDYDNDGDYDVILADANHSGDYYLVINGLADVFVLYGQAQSTNIAAGALDEKEHAVTRIRLVNLTQTYRGQGSPVYDGLKVELDFSNDGGANWEIYQTWEGNQIATVNNGHDVGWYDFKHQGADLKWRLILTAEYDSMTDFPDNNASYDTPSIAQIGIEYEYVFRQEYSRSSAAATITTLTGEKKRLVFGSSFIYPGWEGQLRAYDVTSTALSAGQDSVLKTLTASDLGSATGRTAESPPILWDAGFLLQDRDADDRTIYTAIRSDKVLTNPLQRELFVRTNTILTATSPVNRNYLQDVQNDNAGLIDFIRGKNPNGTDREWKLGDINHSSPVVVGPPVENPSFMADPTYVQFLEEQKTRTKVIYVGANDGMLHCFDAATGEELWGFIPYNLLPKLTNQWKVAINTSRYYNHDIFVDGSPAVADVQIGGEWKTVLICGQGPGKGTVVAGGYNYYFALDITEPTNPIPLWEITHKSGSNYTMGETWSVPAIGKIDDGGTERWVAFMGSGYNNVGQSTAGRYFYVVRIDKTGVSNDSSLIIRNVSVTNVNTNANGTMSGWKRSYKYADIPAAIVASPTALDSDNDGKINSVYVGDLDGRLYRMNMTSPTRTNWNLTAIYTDALYYPIITKPAVWIDPLSEAQTPSIYFGTGGHDAAPSDRQYSFVALTDTGSSAATVEWYIGNSDVLGGPPLFPLSKKVGEDEGLGAGYKVWADPVVSDFIVYCSTLPGSIEAVNPCVNLEGAGRLYARSLRSATTGQPVGGTAFKKAAGNPPEKIEMVSKARRAVTVGDTVSSGGINKREVFIQEYNSTIEMLEQPIESPKLQIKSWREIYKII